MGSVEVEQLPSESYKLSSAVSSRLSCPRNQTLFTSYNRSCNRQLKCEWLLSLTRSDVIRKTGEFVSVSLTTFTFAAVREKLPSYSRLL